MTFFGSIILIYTFFSVKQTITYFYADSQGLILFVLKKSFEIG
jgi:hypothetical protein